MEEQKTTVTDDNRMDENKQKISGIWDNIMAFLHDLLDIREDSDRHETIDSVRKDISFQGHNAWILIFSIMVASIGLNANSPAVVIGAMLISPLMGPIVGMGLGTAINDSKMLRRSLTNLGVMVVLSLLTATLYFLISPIKVLTDELASRTSPNILDVLVAIFGGLALIVAKAKKGTISNAIAGVAIATALMPPLCTAGYGIATGHWEYFGGAMYLFCINAVFIALTTYLVCKLLHFPMVKYANEAKRKRTSRIAAAVGILVLAPSIYFFIQLYQKQQYEQAALDFVKEIVIHDGTIASFEPDFSDKFPTVVLLGAEVPEIDVKDWERKFYKKEVFEGFEIKFIQGSRTVLTDVNADYGKLQEERINDIKLIQNKDQRIAALEAELRRVHKQSKDFEVISEEVRLNYPQISSISYAESVNKDFITQLTDTIAEYNIRFADTTLTPQDRGVVKTRMANWLRYRLKSDKININELEFKVVDTVKVEVVE